MMKYIFYKAKMSIVLYEIIIKRALDYFPMCVIR